MHRVHRARTTLLVILCVRCTPLPRAVRFYPTLDCPVEAIDYRDEDRGRVCSALSSRFRKFHATERSDRSYSGRAYVSVNVVNFPRSPEIGCRYTRTSRRISPERWKGTKPALSEIQSRVRPRVQFNKNIVH